MSADSCSISPLSTGPNLPDLCNDSVDVEICLPMFAVQRRLNINLNDTIWSVKQSILADLDQKITEGFNYGLFLPPSNGRAGKFLLEDRIFRDYPFNDCEPYLELKYKKRVYKTFNVDLKLYKQLHSKRGLRKFLSYVHRKDVKKIELMCQAGLDPNFHAANGETPLTLAAGVNENKPLLMALVAGGAHLDFRNLRSETALHRAVRCGCTGNVKALLDLGASARSRDKNNLTPLYYACAMSSTGGAAAGLLLSAAPDPNVAEMLLRDFAPLGVVDAHGNAEIHQACRNGLVVHLEHLLFYGADVDCQNYAGNTPLHISIINNQLACIKVLLFRKANASIYNNSNQTPYHMAIKMGFTDMLEIFRTYDPEKAVPYRSQPRYNSKRRLTLSRAFMSGSYYGCGGRRSLQPYSLENFYSDYGSLGKRNSVNPDDREPSTIYCAPSTTSTVSSTICSETLAPGNFNDQLSVEIQSVQDKKSYQGSISQKSDVFMSNACTITIPKLFDGFGFSVYDVQKNNHELYVPSCKMPSLTFCDNVHSEILEKLGLKTGDFLLEVNGIDVRRWTAEEVSKLIFACSDHIIISVMHRQHTLKSASGKDDHGLNNQENSAFTKFDQLQTSYIPATFRQPETKFASIKSRLGKKPRISAAELEMLMSNRRNSIASTSSTTTFEKWQHEKDESITSSKSNKTKIYGTVAEVKRRNEVAQSDRQVWTTYNQEKHSKNGNITQHTNNKMILLRPKTPPPPPPLNHQNRPKDDLPVTEPSSHQKFDDADHRQSVLRGASDDDVVRQQCVIDKDNEKQLEENVSSSSQINTGPPDTILNLTLDLKNALAKRRRKIISSPLSSKNNIEDRSFLACQDSSLNRAATETSSSTDHLAFCSSISPDSTSTTGSSVNAKSIGNNESGYSSLRSSLDKPDDQGVCQPEAIDKSTFQNTEMYNIGYGLTKVDSSDRSVDTWSVCEVTAWLDTLYLSQYKRDFETANVDGQQLSKFTRADFARIGITRIAHRLLIENALKTLKHAT